MSVFPADSRWSALSRGSSLMAVSLGEERGVGCNAELTGVPGSQTQDGTGSSLPREDCEALQPCTPPPCCWVPWGPMCRARLRCLGWIVVSHPSCLTWGAWCKYWCWEERSVLQECGRSILYFIRVWVMRSLLKSQIKRSAIAYGTSATC